MKPSRRTPRWRSPPRRPSRRQAAGRRFDLLRRRRGGDSVRRRRRRRSCRIRRRCGRRGAVGASTPRRAPARRRVQPEKSRWRASTAPMPPRARLIGLGAGGVHGASADRRARSGWLGAGVARLRRRRRSRCGCCRASAASSCRRRRRSRAGGSGWRPSVSTCSPSPRCICWSAGPASTTRALLVLPVLMAGVLTSRLLALAHGRRGDAVAAGGGLACHRSAGGTARADDAVRAGRHRASSSIALLAGELARRLAREESPRAAAWSWRASRRNSIGW